MRFYKQLAALNLEMVRPPAQDELDRYIKLTGGKDARVLAAAVKCGANYLLTLDRRHLLTLAVRSSGLNVNVITPEDILRKLAPPS